MAQFNVTYEIVTPESAEYGDAEDRGFICENVSLRDAIDELGIPKDGYEANEWPLSDSVRWITAYRVNDDNDGEESRSLHFPDSLTPSTRRRICRLFGLI